MPLAGDEDEMGFDAGLPETAMKLHAVFGRNEGVVLTMDEQKRRSGGANVVDRTGAHRERFLFFDRAAEQSFDVAGAFGVGILPAQAQEIGRGIKCAHGADAGGAFEGAEQGGEMTASGFAAHADAVRIESETRAIFPQPGQGGTAIIDLRGIFRFVAEAILDRGDGDVVAGEVAHIEVIAFEAALPASAKDPQDDRDGFVRPRNVEVHVQGAALGRGEANVAMDLFARAWRSVGGATGKEENGRERKQVGRRGPQGGSCRTKEHRQRSSSYAAFSTERFRGRVEGDVEYVEQFNYKRCPQGPGWPATEARPTTTKRPPPIMAQYHLSKNGKQSGPFSQEQLDQMLQSGMFVGTELVKEEGSPDWKPVTQLRGFVRAPVQIPFKNNNNNNTCLILGLVGGAFALILVVVCSLLAAIAVPNFLRARKRSQATRTLEDLRLIDAAIDQYAIEHNKPDGFRVEWADIQGYLKPGSKLYNSDGRDLFGNPFGPDFAVDTIPAVPDATFEMLSDVAPADFWSPFIK